VPFCSISHINPAFLYLSYASSFASSFASILISKSGNHSFNYVDVGLLPEYNATPG
jgi:hypothetical protein